jgi:thioesterase domain-containing protein
MTLFRAPTIERLAKLLCRGPQDRFPSEVAQLRSSGSKSPIFAMNMGTQFYALSERLGPDWPFNGLYLLTESNYSNLEDVASEYIGRIRKVQPGGPYALLGWCYGGALAVEVACQLVRAGEQISFVGIIDGVPAGRPKALRALKQRLARFALRLRQARSEGRGTAGFLAEDLSARLRRVIRGPGEAQEAIEPSAAWQIDRLAELVQHHEQKAFPGKVTVFRAAQEATSWPFDLTFGWHDFAQGGVEVVTLPGDHLSIFAGAGLLQMATHIAATLDRLSPQRGPAPTQLRRTAAVAP